ncbi:MAG: conjugal transfer protein TraH [Proteobacteria bacterium]|nr:conjugal transfer protein TraH [Pseudomonadota bacterium]
MESLTEKCFLSSDHELAELLMSLSGTIILQGGSGDTSSHQFKVLSSLAADNQLLKTLLHGGSAKVYVCDTQSPEGCLNPSIQTLNVSPDSGLQTQVSKLLQDMTDKILTDTTLTQTEIGLLQSTRLPIYKMLNGQSAFVGDKQILDIVSYADVITTDILFQYLDENLSVVHTSVSSLQYPESIMEPFEQGINQARSSVGSAQRNATSQISLAAQLINQTQTIEQMLSGELSSQMSDTLQWADRLRE